MFGDYQICILIPLLLLEQTDYSWRFHEQSLMTSASFRAETFVIKLPAKVAENLPSFHFPQLTWMIHSLLSLLAPWLLKPAQLAPITLNTLRHILRSCLISAPPLPLTVNHDLGPMYSSSPHGLDRIERQVGRLNFVWLGITPPYLVTRSKVVIFDARAGIIEGHHRTIPHHEAGPYLRPS